ncbi:MAG: excinuclease ABC subunit UvrA [Cytophagales bacterium]|nr:excinuclease ABC subunit UvrA [Cytophagales bacterium]
MSEPKNIIIKKARVNNLKNISLSIPRNELIVISGVSGSGKTSLAFDTIFAEGQRKYIESLSSYARQFLKRMDKPNVDMIEGLSPAIAVDQKRNNKNPRSTVGTLSEVYDYLKLLYLNIGQTISPVSGNVVKKDSYEDVLKYVLNNKGKKYFISIYRKTTKENYVRELEVLLNKGFTRLIIEDEFYTIESVLTSEIKHLDFQVLIDRGVVHVGDENFKFKVVEVCKEAFFEGEGRLLVTFPHEKKEFSNRFELDGIKFLEPSINLFSFNNPYGACSECGGFGNVLGFDENKIIPNKNLSIFSNCIAPWRTEKMKVWLKPLISNNREYKVNIHKPFNQLSPEETQIIWEGKGAFKGINKFFQYLEKKSYKIQFRIIASRYKGKTKCKMCLGSGIREEANYIKINNKSIIDIVLSPIDNILTFLKELSLTDNEKKLSERPLQEIITRLNYINEIGLGYLTLNRKVNSLSGGEFQRIKLATSLGSSLVGSLYVLDEPTVGLHPHNTNKLIEILRSLKNIGNTVIVVEHDEDVILSSDYLIDIGPGAGSKGGEVVYSGKTKSISKSTDSPTSDFIFNKKKMEKSHVRKHSKKITICQARENNLKNIDVNFPLECLVVVTGVSGSGKSTLVKQILHPALAKRLDKKYDKEGNYGSLKGDIQNIQNIEMVDQNPVGRSSRSNPATYSKAYDAIRKIFSSQGFKSDKSIKPSDFSFNVDGGRCDECLGDGTKKIEMQFMADLYLECSACKGKRFKKKILEITYNDKNIYDVLEMTIEESHLFFSSSRTIQKKLKPMLDVGLGYLRLGQSSSTLSGGEAQRLKLATYLLDDKKLNEKTLFIFDEPSSGLHNKDISYFMTSVFRLIDSGNSVIIIEHNTELIKQADWIIDMGPDGGQGGGLICFEGTPQNLIKLRNNKTAKYLKREFVI